MAAQLLDDIAVHMLAQKLVPDEWVTAFYLCCAQSVGVAQACDGRTQVPVILYAAVTVTWTQLSRQHKREAACRVVRAACPLSHNFKLRSRPIVRHRPARSWAILLPRASSRSRASCKSSPLRPACRTRQARSRRQGKRGSPA